MAAFSQMGTSTGLVTGTSATQNLLVNVSHVSQSTAYYVPSTWIPVDARSARSLTIPRPGMWIIERAVGAAPRQVLEVEPHQRILTLGLRRSVIEWSNLRRYAEWDPVQNQPVY